MNFSNTITLDDSLLQDLPTLEVFKDQTIQYYITRSVSNGELNFVNISDKSDEYIIDIRTLVADSEIGRILNIDDYYLDLKEASINQEIIDYQTEKRISDYNY